MFLNNTNCDVYIGTGAGKKLMEDIENARYSVKILSPFLSPSLVRKLIDLHYKGINVQLITTDTIEDFYGDRKRNIHELIHQHIHIDREAEDLRNRWKKIKKLVNWSMILCIGILGYLALEVKNISTLGILIPIVLLFITGQFLQSKIKGKRVFSYTYEQLFPFKVVTAPDKAGYNDLYLHGKVYLIDENIAYLGSLNFTSSGTKSNYETRIRLSDKASVQKIIEEFDRLFSDKQLSELCIQSWGKLLYQEPVN